MAPLTKLLPVLGLALATLDCSTSRDPAKGFRLAGSGESTRGKAAFVEFKCTECHEVTGSNLPRPAGKNVLLGGSVLHQPSDGYLVTAIINPAFHAANYPTGGGQPEQAVTMPDYTGRMTVQQLTDIVCYLQTRYALKPMPVKSEYP